MNNNIYKEINNNSTKKKSVFITSCVTISKCIIISIFLSILIVNFLFQVVTVDGDSMIPTLHTKDRLILDKLSYYFSKPKTDDIVVLIPPNNPDKKFIKRVLAVAGDTVQIKDHKLYVNNKEVNEWYINEAMNGPYDVNFKDVQTVPENSVCVLGDNRNHSEDSRDPEMGFVPLKNIIGKANFKIYPLSNFGTLK